MNNVMVDLETVGKRAGCGVLSIGAVAFDPEKGELGEKFYEVVYLPSCEELGLHSDPDTMAWWGKQSPEAREVLAQAEHPTTSIPLADALARFNTYLEQFGKRTVKVWGNGSDFDNAILANCYAAAGLEPSWEFWNNRCFRTLKNLCPELKMPRTGTHHNALDDAVTQAQFTFELFRALKGNNDAIAA